MSTNPSGGWWVYKHPQYCEEATFGTFPANPNNDFSWIGPSESWDPRAEKPPIEIRQLGSEDPRFLLAGRENYSMTLEHFIQGATWIGYAINSQGSNLPTGVGTIDKSVSLCMAIYKGGAGGTPVYYQMKGCRPNSVTLSGKVNEAIKCRMELLCRQIPTPGETDPIVTAGGSWATDPGTSPFIFTSGGLDAIQVGGVTVPTTEISVTVDRNLEPVYVIGSGLAEWLPAKQRSITGSMTLVWNNTNRYQDLQDYTDRTIVWKLKDGGTTLTLTGCKFHRMDSFTVKPNEVVMEKWSFTALTAAIV
jgi:hypothetical protein